MHTPIPFLWFDKEAEEAARFYVSVFKNSKITGITRYGKAGTGPEGSIMTVSFVLNGQRFTALNGGPAFKFTEAISFTVECRTQAEVDYYWKTLSKGGKPNACGWLKDRYGLSWQITPKILMDMIGDRDAEKAERVMRAMMRMKKIEIQGLKKAYKQKSTKRHPHIRQPSFPAVDSNCATIPFSNSTSTLRSKPRRPTSVPKSGYRSPDISGRP